MNNKILQTNTSPLKRVEVDTVTVDIIENALSNAREEMDAVLFRTAMSPGIREQGDWAFVDAIFFSVFLRKSL